MVGSVTLTVKVLESALESKEGPGKVVNGGETAWVKVGNDSEYTLETVDAWRMFRWPHPQHACAPQ